MRKLAPHLIWAFTVLLVACAGVYVLLVLSNHPVQAHEFGGGVLTAFGIVAMVAFVGMFLL